MKLWWMKLWDYIIPRLFKSFIFSFQKYKIVWTETISFYFDWSRVIIQIVPDRIWWRPRCPFLTPSVQCESHTTSPCHRISPRDTISSMYLRKRWWEWELLLPHFPSSPSLGAPLGKCCTFTLRMTQMVCALYNMAAALNMNTTLQCPLTTFRCLNRLVVVIHKTSKVPVCM